VSTALSPPDSGRTSFTERADHHIGGLVRIVECEVVGEHRDVELVDAVDLVLHHNFTVDWDI
jgi:hypothetical protein